MQVGSSKTNLRIKDTTLGSLGHSQAFSALSLPEKPRGDHLFSLGAELEEGHTVPVRTA